VLQPIGQGANPPLQCCTDLGPARTWTWVPDLRSHRFGILGQVPDLQPNFMMYGSVKQV
jgi:hypothetical protein